MNGPPGPPGNAALRLAWARLPRGLRSLFVFLAGSALALALLGLALAGLSRLIGSLVSLEGADPRSHFGRVVKHPIPRGVDIRFSHIETTTDPGRPVSRLQFTAPVEVVKDLLTHHRLAPASVLSEERAAGLFRPDWRPQGAVHRAVFPSRPGLETQGILLFHHKETGEVWFYQGPL